MSGIATERSSSQMGAVLQAATDFISERESVMFTQYNRSVLSQDGYVFWVATQNTATYMGSLHVASTRVQQEDQTAARNDIIFTSDEEITQFNLIAPGTMWVGSVTVGNNDIVIAFSSRDSYYKQSDLWHYRGIAVWPAMQSQLVQSSADLPAGPIVSNSLPIWLALTQDFKSYPSFLVPDNTEPPYASVDVASTSVIGPMPIVNTTTVGTGIAPITDWSVTQLLCDDVRMTFYGLTNLQAQQWLGSVYDTSRNTDDFGFLSYPVFVDEKRPQPEIAAIGMKKVVRFRASYYLNTADVYARRYILSAVMTASFKES